MAVLALVDAARWAKGYYRCARWMHLRGFMKLARFTCFIGRWSTSVEIRPSASIGKNLYLPHPNGIVIGDMVTVGDSVTIMQQVTLGTVHIKSTYTSLDVPSIGENVMIGAGAKVLGGIKIGAGSSIGANAVVLQDVPENSIAVGVPAKILTKR